MEGPESLLCDGDYAHALAQRGHVSPSTGTPEHLLRDRRGAQQLAREYAMCGSDVAVAFTTKARRDWLDAQHDAAEVNRVACEIATDRPGAVVMVPISPTSEFDETGSCNARVCELFSEQCRSVRDHAHVILADGFDSVDECCIAVSVFKRYARSGTLIACTMAIGPNGDRFGVSVEQCALRLANEGADLVGAGGAFDPFLSLHITQRMQDALTTSGRDPVGGKPRLICRPVAYFTPDAAGDGVASLAEYPLALEPRQCTRFDARHYAQRAKAMGVKVVGAGVGFEPYHLREMASVLRERPSIAEDLHESASAALRSRACLAYWTSRVPATGRPFSPCFSECTPPPDATVTRAVQSVPRDQEGRRRDSAGRPYRERKGTKTVLSPRVNWGDRA